MGACWARNSIATHAAPQILRRREVHAGVRRLATRSTPRLSSSPATGASKTTNRAPPSDTSPSMWPMSMRRLGSLPAESQVRAIEVAGKARRLRHRQGVANPEYLWPDCLPRRGPLCQRPSRGSPACILLCVHDTVPKGVVDHHAPTAIRLPLENGHRKRVHLVAVGARG